MYLLVTDVTVHIPGDERSITHPGHGYPAHEEHYKEVQEFQDNEIEKLKEILLRLEPGSSRRKFVVYKATKAELEYKVQVNIHPKE